MSEIFITPEEFKQKMEELAKDTDHEKSHSEADDLVSLVLKQLGYGEGVKIYEEMVRLGKQKNGYKSRRVTQLIAVC